MNTQFSDVQILIWDFDGTFYRQNENLFRQIRQAEYKVIMEHTGWDRRKTEEEFAKLHKVTIESATEVTAKLCGISIPDAAEEMESRFDRREFVSHDEKLVAMFAKLKHFRHFTLANGLIRGHKETMELLGISPDIFEEMVSPETVGVTKPDEKGFRHILKKTGLPPSAHMMIGDREAVDLVPAKALGMHTCLVWSEKKSTIADITLSTVYELPNILT